MRVVFVQKFVPHYRLPFFEGLRARLAARGDELVLIYGPPDPFEGSKVKTVSPDWGIAVRSRIMKLAGRYLYWQGAYKYIQKDDLVVVEHAAKLLDNYPIFLMQKMGRIKMGYFGHGENFQSKYELPISRVIKKAMLRSVARWFAYTEVSRQSLLRQGVEADIISVVNNTLARPESLESLADEPSTKNRFLYIGGMYKDKRIDVLLEAAEIVRSAVPDFELHLVGSGPQQNLVEEAAKRHSWVTFHGQLYGQERDALIASSEAILMPGLVGLVAIDSFFFASPIITSHAGQHSPEIAYLEDEKNALFDGPGTARSYAELVNRFISDTELRQRLCENCRLSADRYSIDNMVTNFCAGLDSLIDPDLSASQMESPDKVS